MYILSQLINRFYRYFDLVINIITGLVYGAKENKRLQVFIDDLNLPVPDEDGVQRCNEVHTVVTISCLNLFYMMTLT